MPCVEVSLLAVAPEVGAALGLPKLGFTDETALGEDGSCGPAASVEQACKKVGARLAVPSAKREIRRGLLEVISAACTAPSHRSRRHGSHFDLWIGVGRWAPFLRRVHFRARGSAESALVWRRPKVQVEMMGAWYKFTFVSTAAEADDEDVNGAARPPRIGADSTASRTPSTPTNTSPIH